MNRSLTTIGLLCVMMGCSKKGQLFSNPSPKETGITFVNQLTETDDLSILDYLYFYNGGGVAIGDINNDQLPDIFLSGNQVDNKLYLNKGNLKFEDITETAGVAGNSSWNTGAVMGDVNGDGLLDIYVCAVVGLKGFGGHNELYLNNGDGTFTESASKYGLDFDSYSSNAAFLDYDLDGDLDIYLLNHAVHTQESFGKAELRNKRNYESGDKLLRNDGEKFTDVSEEAGIYGGVNGYGLGIAVADLNQDGWPDIYVGNDFHEDDYYYLNDQDGTFSEEIKTHFGHISRFSMGNDVADLNGDGRPDLISLDMLPEDEKVLKASEGDDNVQVQRMRTHQFGYHYQFTRNMLYANRPSGDFEEIALMSGVAATDWSWSALFADYDQDGQQDLFIANGIPKRPNDLDFINFVSSEQIRNKINNTKLVDQQALDLMPSGNVHNYVFKGKKNFQFEDLSGKWIRKDTIISGATAMADLDNDGDIDLITNNLNTPPSIYENKTNESANYLKIELKFGGKNPFGIGTKVYAYHQGKLQFRELYTVRGFQASSEPMIHFGFEKAEKVDSIKIVWPNKTFQLMKDVPTNQRIAVSPKGVKPFKYGILHQPKSLLFELTDHNLGIDFTHVEDNYTDFNRQKLMPYQASDRGPAMAIGDLNNDGADDIFFGGSKKFPSKVFLRSDSTYIEGDLTTLKHDAIKEDVSATIADLNNDGKNDIFIGSGGADFFGEAKPLLDGYFVQADSTFTAAALPRMYQNASTIKVKDFDSDGDQDIFVGNHIVTGDFGKTPNSYLLENENGAFIIAAELSPGMTTDAVWSDFDQDGDQDLIVVGEWMPPTFYQNDNGQLKEQDVTSEKLNGLWQSIQPFDIDHDGDLDYLLGNWGTNSKFKASSQSPMKLFYGDFDKNGQTETIVATEKNGRYFPLVGLNDLAGQMVSLKKTFNDYKSFAGKTVEEIIGKASLSEGTVLTVDMLASGYLRNDSGRFVFVPFEDELQVSPIMAFTTHDFDGDGAEEVLAGGNYFGVKPYHGRYDSFSGALIKSENDVILGYELGLSFTQRSVRHLNTLKINGKDYLLATMNNDRCQVYQILK